MGNQAMGGEGGGADIRYDLMNDYDLMNEPESLLEFSEILAIASNGNVEIRSNQNQVRM